MPGHELVERKEYVLRSNTLRRDIYHDQNFELCVSPGHHITMSMQYTDYGRDQHLCPRCKYVNSNLETQAEVKWFVLQASSGTSP